MAMRDRSDGKGARPVVLPSPCWRGADGSVTGPDPSPGESGDRRWIRTILSFLSRAVSCEGAARGHWLAQDVLGSHVERKKCSARHPLGPGVPLGSPIASFLQHG